MQITLIQIDELRHILSEEIAEGLEKYHLNLTQKVKPATEPEYMSLTQLCEFLGKSKPTIIAWRRKGYLPMGRKIGNTLFFNKQRVMDALAQGNSSREGLWKK